MRIPGSLLVVILLLAASCHRSKMQQGYTAAVSAPVVITPDASLFRKGGVWPDAPFEFNFFYSNQNALYTDNEMLALKQGEDSKLYLSTPFYLKAQREPCPYMFYPGEHITIRREQDETLSYTVEGSPQRNNELKITKILYLKSYEKSYSFYMAGYNIRPAGSLLQTEALVEGTIPLISYNLGKLIDSLAAAYPVSERFKTYLAGAYRSTAGTGLESMVLYNYKDQYIRQQLYDQRIRKITESYGAIQDKETLCYLKDNLNGLFTRLIEDNKMKWLIRTDAHFIDQYTFAVNSFQGLARDYLLAKIMYWSITHDIPAAYNYMEKFRQDCRDEDFKKGIEKEVALRKKLYRKIASPEGNFLLEPGLKRKKDITDVIGSFDGNLVLVDFWASWCQPCREEMPAARELEKRYAGKKIRFMYVSLDKDINSWKRASVDENLLPYPNYILLNTRNSSFVKEFNIQTIPRYMLIGKDGAILSDHAPNPSDPALQQLIDRHLP